jgi:hydrogenase/urease accessory protein HupE
VKLGRLVLFAELLLLAGSDAKADVVYPARLSLSEIERGAYDVSFTLPIFEGGRKLRAEPALPRGCRDTTEHRVETTATSYTASWKTICEPASLAGEAVLVRGLLGTQTEILVEIRTLDGRVHSELLKPSRPGLIVPEPPSWIALARSSALSGMRRVVTYGELWVLALVVAALGLSRGATALGIAAFASAHAIGQWAAARNTLLVSAHLAPALVVLTALVPALGLVRGRDRSSGWLDPLWLAAALLGVLAGGARPETVPTQGLSSAEQVGAALFFAVGLALGLALVGAVLVELREVLRVRVAPATLALSFGYLAGVASVALLVYRASAFVVGAAAWPSVPLELVLLAAVLGAGAGAHLWTEGGLSSLAGFAALLAAGIGVGFTGRELPLGELLVTGSLLLFGLALVLRTPFRFAAPLAAVAVFAQGFHAARLFSENLSLPVANAAGAGLTALAVFYAFLRIAEPTLSAETTKALRWVGGGVALVAVVLRGAEYYRFLGVQIPTDAALGLVRIPLLALVLAVTAALLWPRRRRVLEELGIERRTGRAHWALVGLAFFLLPVGSVAVRNPFFEPSAPRGDDARRVLSRVLWSTYHAFNIRDEDELYDALSQSVTGELVGDLYLDSRRRLTAGTREGAEITVREVRVVEVGDATRGADTGAGFSYPCKWIVVARVRHLQHVHHRQNIYHGNVAVRIDQDRWKIAGVELTSEDRVVLPWSPT